MLTPEEVWNALVEESGEDAIANAAAVTATQAEKDLSLAGFDVKAERARADATIAELCGAGAPASEEDLPASEPAAWVSVPVPPARRAREPRRVAWLVAALVAAATAGGIVYAFGHRAPPEQKPIEAPSATATASAAPAPTATATASATDTAAPAASASASPPRTMTPAEIQRWLRDSKRR